MGDYVEILAPIAILATLAIGFIVWSGISDNRLKKANPDAWKERHVSYARNNPSRLRELGASPDLIAQAEERQEKKWEEVQRRKSRRDLERRINSAKNDPTKLREIGAPQDVIDAAERRQEEAQDSQYDCLYLSGKVKLRKNIVTHGGNSHDITGSQVAIERSGELLKFSAPAAVLHMLSVGVPGRRLLPDVTRDSSKIYVIITKSDGISFMVDFPQSAEEDARKFALSVSNASSYFFSKSS